MGQMRFLVRPPERLTEEVLELAYLSGMDRVPWLVRTRRDGDELVVERDVSDSGSLTVPWHVEGHGLLALSSATLMERLEPYYLPLELARGTINQVRNHLFEWQMMGVAVPAAIGGKLHEALRHFGRAVVDQEDERSPVLAQEALRMALDAAQALAAAYSEQVMAARRRAGGKLLLLLGGELSGPKLQEPLASQYLSAFNAALVNMPWREAEASEGSFAWAAFDQHIEWCRSHGVKTCAGPLLQLDARGLPDWVYLWEDDIEDFLVAAGEFIKAAVSRYRGKVDLWNCAARVNTSETLSFSEEENLQLAVSTLQLIRALDPNTPKIISVDQPWGEYMSRRAVDFSPLHFVDALARTDLDIKAIMLEINLGCFRGGTLPRSELEISRQLDYWSLLGLPILVALSIPSGDADDQLARRQVKVPRGTWSLESQQDWAARYVRLILAKPGVQGIFWNQLRDDQPHDFPNAGLLADRRPKPALGTLAALRPR
jgi:hypothetical protein